MNGSVEDAAKRAPSTLLAAVEADELALAADPDRHYRTALLPRKTQLYTKYVQTRSLAGDLVILLRTVQAVLRQK